VKVRVLGCGTSTGVPNLRSGWGECDPDEPRNRRTRASILLESGGKRLLIDCGPDMRQQLLDAGVQRLDAVIVTHDHADHVHGIDDLRPLAQVLKAPVPIYCRAELIDRLQERFAYAFVQAGFYPPVVVGRPIADQMEFGEARLRFVDQPHGNITSLGIRIDEGTRSLSYAIDYNEMTPEMTTLYRGSDVLISDCLTRQPHPTHAYLGGALRSARDLKIGQLYLTHMSNSLDYGALVAELPDWAAPAHDGLEIELA
jgi:phosphoribosyl 1,2-cyclic phosphate phosphodiesterase